MTLCARSLRLIMCVLSALILALPPSRADDRHRRDMFPEAQWQPHRPDRGYSERWHHGNWRQDWHDGRFGWWWLVDGAWFHYPQPVYPYPPYAGAPVAGRPILLPGPAVAPAPVMQAAPLPNANFWYFCADPKGYYPYVASCNGPWQEVSSTPPTPALPKQGAAK